jgi:hypothetical protein
MSESEGSPAESSNLVVNLKICGKNFEVTTQGTIKDLVTQLEALTDLTNQISMQMGFESEEQEVVSEQPQTPDLDIPAITPLEGIQDNVLKLFETAWGKTPRTLNQVMQALEQNTVFTSPQNANNAVVRLTKAGKIRRRQNNGKWEYFSIPGRA